MTTPNVPQLRFPQFNKPWVKTKLGDKENQTTFSKGKRISKADITENGRLLCVRYGVLIEKAQSSTDVPENELLLSDGDEVSQKRAIAKCSPGFAGYLFQESSVRRAIKRLAQGISVLGISKTNLEKWSSLIHIRMSKGKLLRC